MLLDVLDRYKSLNERTTSLTVIILDKTKGICSNSASLIARLSTDLGPCITTTLGFNGLTQTATIGERP